MVTPVVAEPDVDSEADDVELDPDVELAQAVELDVSEVVPDPSPDVSPTGPPPLGVKQPTEARRRKDPERTGRFYTIEKPRGDLPSVRAGSSLTDPPSRDPAKRTTVTPN